MCGLFAVLMNHGKPGLIEEDMILMKTQVLLEFLVLIIHWTLLLILMPHQTLLL